MRAPWPSLCTFVTAEVKLKVEGVHYNLWRTEIFSLKHFLCCIIDGAYWSEWLPATWQILSRRARGRHGREDACRLEKHPFPTGFCRNKCSCNLEKNNLHAYNIAQISFYFSLIRIYCLNCCRERWCNLIINKWSQEFDPTAPLNICCYVDPGVTRAGWGHRYPRYFATLAVKHYESSYLGQICQILQTPFQNESNLKCQGNKKPTSAWIPGRDKVEHKLSSAYVGGPVFMHVAEIKQPRCGSLDLASLLLLCHKATRAAEDTRLMKYKMSLKLLMN